MSYEKHYSIQCTGNATHHAHIRETFIQEFKSIFEMLLQEFKKKDKYDISCNNMDEAGEWTYDKKKGLCFICEEYNNYDCDMWRILLHTISRVPNPFTKTIITWETELHYTFDKHLEDDYILQDQRWIFKYNTFVRNEKLAWKKDNKYKYSNSLK